MATASMRRRVLLSLCGLLVATSTIGAAATPGSLAATGVDFSWLVWVALGVLVVGGVVFWLSRRRGVLSETDASTPEE